MWVEALQQQQKLDEAIRHIKESIKIAQATESGMEEGKSLRVKGKILVAMDRVDKAIAMFEESLARLDSNDTYEAALTRFAWGKVLVNEQIDLAKGINLIQGACEEFDRLGVKHY